MNPEYSRICTSYFPWSADKLRKRSAIDGRQCENKQHCVTVPEKARDMFLCSPHINIKKARQVRFSTAGYVCSTQNRVVFNTVVGNSVILSCTPMHLGHYDCPVAEIKMDGF